MIVSDKSYTDKQKALMAMSLVEAIDVLDFEDDVADFRTRAEAMAPLPVAPDPSDVGNWTLLGDAVRARLRSAVASILELMAEISPPVWMEGGWNKHTARASEGPACHQTFANFDQSLTATLERKGQQMLLTVEAMDDRWRRVVIPLVWHSLADDGEENRCILTVLEEHRAKYGAGKYVAEVKLGELDSITLGMPPDPLPLERLTLSESEWGLMIRESIEHAYTNHELQAWMKLSENEELNPEIRGVIRAEVQSRS
jgi:hypothetical protein